MIGVRTTPLAAAPLEAPFVLAGSASADNTDGSAEVKNACQVASTEVVSTRYREYISRANQAFCP